MLRKILKIKIVMLRVIPNFGHLYKGMNINGAMRYSWSEADRNQVTGLHYNLKKRR
jgi:hypothetical protein